VGLAARVAGWAVTVEAWAEEEEEEGESGEGWRRIW